MADPEFEAKPDPGDWPAFLVAVAALLAAEGAGLFVAADAPDGLEECARSGKLAPDRAAIASAVGGALEVSEKGIARFVDSVPALTRLSETGSRNLLFESGPLLRQVVVPVIVASGRVVWLAISADLGHGDAASEQDLLDRLSGASLLVAARLDDTERMIAARYQSLVYGLAQSAPLSFLVAADGTLVAASSAGARWLESGRLASLDPASRLRLATAAASAELEAAIGDVALRGASHPTVQRNVRLDGRHAAGHWIAVVRPMPKPGVDARSLGALSPLTRPDRRAVCWVALRGSPIAGVPEVEALRQAFRFTESEAELVRHLMLGRTVTSQAAERGVTPDAANHHMKNVYIKTGCKRHTELVMLVRAVMGCSIAADIDPAILDDAGVAR